MTYTTNQDADITTEMVLEDIEGDFDSYLSRRQFDQCDVLIDNLRDLGFYSKGIELAKRLCAAKLRVPADYGEEKTPFEHIMETNDHLFNAIRNSEKDEEVIY